MELTALVSYLDGYLRVAEVPDAPHAVNGLQVANAGTVSRVAAAVDLCEATVRLAAEQGADLLLVHHGLFWGGLQPLTGRAYRRVTGLVTRDIALYSAHLPLDLHPEVGNNAVLAGSSASRCAVNSAKSTACRSAGGETWTCHGTHSSAGWPDSRAAHRGGWHSAPSG